MSSPVRFEADYANVDGEELSPIKLSPTKLEYGSKTILPLKKYPHGLHAKDENRRKTVHQSTLEDIKTPTHLKSMRSRESRLPLTSPLSTLQPSLDSLKKSKINLDAKLKQLRSSNLSSPSNKENIYMNFKAKSPTQKFGIGVTSKSPNIRNLSDLEASIANQGSLTFKSSPLRQVHKRSSQDDLEIEPRKSPKVVESLNDFEEVGDTSVRIDEVFNKEDIISQIESKSSPQTHKVRRAVEDGTSDADESLIAANISNTEHNDFESTQFTKEFKLIEDDYITPQRYTEPVAKRPKTSQLDRVSENFIDEETTKDISPLKDRTSEKYIESYKNSSKADIDVARELRSSEMIVASQVDNTESFNIPIFTFDQVEEIQQKHKNELNSLQSEISSKNKRILDLSEDRNRLQNEMLTLSQDYSELKSSLDLSEQNENILRTRCMALQREYISAQQKGEELKKSIEDVKIENSDILQKNEDLLSELKSTSARSEQIKIEVIDLEKKRLEYEDEIEANKVQIETLQQFKVQLERDLKDTIEKNIELLSEKEILEQKNEKLSSDFSALREEHQNVMNINSKQQELLNELDNLENLAKDKILLLESSLSSKTKELQKVNNEKVEQAKIINALKSENESLKEIVSQHDSNVLDLRKASFESLENEKTKAKDRIQELERLLDESKRQQENLTYDVRVKAKEVDNLSQLIEEYKEQQHLLQSINSEKDEIIGGDTKKIGELVEKLNEQKQAFSEVEKNYLLSSEKVKELEHEKSSISSLTEEIDDLKKQIAQSHARTNSKIQEVAEQLYFEYSKKHELKVNQVRAGFKKQIESLNFDKKAQSRDIESLQQKLEAVNTEKAQLIKLLEEYQSASGIGDRHKLSPKKSGIKKPLRH